MHKLIIFAVCIVAMTASVKAGDDIMRTFTSIDGKEFKGRLIDIRDDEVEIKRQDGFKFKSDISIFSDTDRAYFREWNFQKILKNLDLNITNNRLTETVYTTTQGVDEVTYKYARYEVEMKNNSFDLLEDIRVEYMFYVKVYDRNDTPEYRRDTGEHSIKFMSPGADHVFQTKRIVLANRKPAPILNKVKGKDIEYRERDDALIGIIMRIYLGDTLAKTYTDLPEGVDLNKKWPHKNSGRNIINADGDSVPDPSWRGYE